MKHELYTLTWGKVNGLRLYVTSDAVVLGITSDRFLHLHIAQSSNLPRNRMWKVIFTTPEDLIPDNVVYRQMVGETCAFVCLETEDNG